METRMKSVEVVLRERSGAFSCGLIQETIEGFLDYSVNWSISSAACAGHINLLHRLGERKLPISDRLVDWAMRVAADKGDLRVIQWLTAYRPHVRVSTRVMDSAAFAGHLHVVKWLHTNRDEGCTTHAMDSAAASGHLDVVQWLHRHRREGCTTAAMDSAAAGGHLKVLQWLDIHRKEGYTTVAMNFAVFNGHLHILRWFNTRAGTNRMQSAARCKLLRRPSRTSMRM